MLSDVVEVLEQNGFVLVAIFRLKDADFGGHSSRVRVFPYFESNVAADAANRGYGSVLAALSRHLRVRTFQVDPVGDAEQLLDLCLENSHLNWE